MYAPRLLLWGLAGCSLYLTFLALATGSIPLVMTLLLITSGLMGGAETYNDRRRRREEFNRQFATLDDFYNAVDKEALLKLREERGLAVAVRELRRQHPSVSLATAAELVKGL